MKKNSLKAKAYVIFATLAANLVLLGGAAYLHFAATEAIERAHASRYASYLLADELRQSSDDLTRLARTYVATADANYEKQYFEILAIRDGKKPRPEAYHRIYWDFVAADPSGKPRPDAATRPLLQLMRDAGFTDREFAKLEEAKKNSDGLVKTEVIAMNAVKGLYDDGRGNFTVRKDPDQALAIRLMNSAEYHKFKAEIMRPIDEFYVEMERRLDGHLADVLAGAARSRAILVGALAILALSLAGLSAGMYTQVLRPLLRVHGAIDKLLREEYDVDESIARRGDEIGMIGASVLRFRDSLLSAGDLRGRLQADNETRDRRLEAMSTAVGGFTRKVDGTFKSLETSIAKLEHTARTMGSSAEQTRQQTETLSSVSNSTLEATQTVAAATEQLAKSIQEISHRVQESASIAGRATSEANHTAGQVRELSNAATRIGDVVRLINEIASQTNLLALNATIEAARAGDAGKGFAVVASEVKSLAAQTAKATEEIAAQVQSVQGETQTVVRSIQTIGETIGRMNEIAAAVAAAVEEQGAATDEISRNVQQASDSTRQVTDSIGVVRNSADATGAASGDVLGSVAELTQQGRILREDVQGFLAHIKEG
ncbi:MAG: methyl-accepting chemotaxis protein [Rhodospirillales bacterium]|nr:methyl-accepting chemotaxis protein [Rhodospirillales bacterium]